MVRDGIEAWRANLEKATPAILYLATVDLEGIYPRVVHDLSMVYSIGYRPTNSARDGSWRAVTVQLIGHSELSVRARHGYYASRQ